MESVESVSADDGFSSEERLNDDGGRFHQSYPTLASHGKKIYAVWSDHRDDEPRAYFAELK